MKKTALKIFGLCFVFTAIVFANADLLMTMLTTRLYWYNQLEGAMLFTGMVYVAYRCWERIEELFDE